MRTLRTLLALTFVTSMGCSSTSAPEAPSAFPVARSTLSRNTAPNVSDADKTQIASDNAKFAIGLYGALRDDARFTGKNLFFSPHSISTALAMTYAGAKGDTAAEMAKALEFSLPQDRLHPAFNWLDLDLASRGATAKGKDGKPFRLRVTNALFGQKDSQFVPSFLDTLAVNYDTGMNLVDYVKESEPSRVKINAWVADKTEQRIKDLIPNGGVDPSTRLVLVNAVYFNASWKTPFSDTATASAPFTKLDGTTTPANLMAQSIETRYAGDLETYQAVEIPYDGDELSLVAILPAKGTFEAFEKSLTADKLQSILGALKADSVTLKFPKFKIEGGFSLKTAMKSLGMNKAFGGADFSGISTTESLQIQDIFHKGFCAVDEKGTEAAAATAVVVGRTAAPAEPKTFTADHPFLFAVRDKTGAILFVGRIVDPT